MDKLTERLISSPRETVAEIFRLAAEYRDDVAHWRGLNVFEVFDAVRRLEYRSDPDGVERLTRPGKALRPDAPYRDCDEKTVLLAAWYELTGTPYRIVIAGNQIHEATGKPYPHHVYPEMFNRENRTWYVTDATYPDRSVFGVRLYRPERFRRVFNRAR